jgi:hypothetical protein
MEIREYIREYRRSKRRWLPLLVAVPILAGASSAAILAVQPVESTARVQMRVPSSYAIGDSQIGLYIARVSEALKLPSVQKDIVGDSGIPPAQLSSLTAERRDQSDQFVVSLTTTAGPDRTLTTVVAAGKISSVWVAKQDTSRTDAALKVAQAGYDQAQNALSTFQDEIDNLDPTVTYQTVLRLLITPPPSVSLESLRAQQAALVPQVRRYNQLRDAVNMTNGQLGAARAASAIQQGLVATAESGELILESHNVGQSRVQPIINGAALAAVMAFALVLGLSMLPDLLRRQRTRATAAESRPESEGVKPDPQPADDGQEPAQPAATAAEPQDRPDRDVDEPNNGRIPAQSPSGSSA